MAPNMSYTVFINESSGSVLELGQNGVKDIINKSGIQTDKIIVGPLDEYIEDLCQAARQGRKVLVGGGDGTVKFCASRLFKEEKPFGVLPLGTMNLLAKDLNVPVDLKEALAAYAQGCEEISIDLAKVNGEIFLCCAGIGTMPETSEYREKYRQQKKARFFLVPRVMAYMLRQMDKARKRRLDFKIAGEAISLKTSALVVSNNKYTSGEEWKIGNFKRSSLTSGKLGIYAITPTRFVDKLTFLGRLAFGTWKKDRAVQEWEVEDLIIECKEKPLLVSLDGETKRITPPLKFDLLPSALKMLRPSYEGGKS